MPEFEHKSPVYHVGNLDADRDPPRYSFEGAGISVSKHPDAWRRIASTVSGDTYTLTNPDSTFYTVDPAALPLDDHIEWCRETEFITETTGYRVETHDGGFMQFYEYETAEREASEHGTTPDATTVYALGPRGRRYWDISFTSSPDTADPLAVESLLPVWFARYAHDVDGVWWDYELAPDDYSAPTGVIFQSQRKNWTITRTDAHA